jgi:hypothetical protein
VRVVEGGEIMHIITCISEGMRVPGFKAFNILGGIATVYRPCIDVFNENPRKCENINWLKDNWYLYRVFNPLDYNEKFRKNIISFSYKDESIIDMVKYSLDITQKIILPTIDKIINLNSCIEYFDKTNKPRSSMLKPLNVNDFIKASYDEGLLYVKTGNLSVGFYDKVYQNPDLYAKYMTELERRKEANTETLRSYGLEL